MSVRYRIITLDNGWNYTIQKRKFMGWFTIDKSDDFGRAEAKLKDHAKIVHYYDSTGKKYAP